MFVAYTTGSCDKQLFSILQPDSISRKLGFFCVRMRKIRIYLPQFSNFLQIYFTLIIPLQLVLPKASKYQHCKSSVLQGLQLSNDLIWQANRIKLQLYPFSLVPQLQIINITESKVLCFNSLWVVRTSPVSLSQHCITQCLKTILFLIQLFWFLGSSQKQYTSFSLKL